MSLIFSIGQWGGFYFYWGYSKRICLGWVAVTIVPCDIDVIFDRYFAGKEEGQ